MIRLKHILATAVLMCCCLATYAQTISNKGKEFWVGYGHHQFMENGSNTQNMVIYLSTEEQAAVVTVTIDSSGNPALPPNAGGLWTRTYNLAPFTVVQTAIIPKGTTAAPTPADANYDARLYDIAPPTGNGGAGLFRKRGIHIVSTAPIVAYAHIYGSASSGATMLMPVVAWGYNYMSLNSKQSYAQDCYNWMYVIASKDNTVIEITPSVKTRAQNKTGLAPGVTKQITLMKGQIYQVIGANDGADANGNGGTASTGLDLSGTTVKSIGGGLGDCYPIAVFAGSSRTANPASCGSGGGDNDNQQLFPLHAWGKRYATVPFSNSTTPTNYTTNTFKIGVMDPTTKVYKNGVLLTGLISGKYYSYESASPDYIESDKPIMVSQFMTGGGCLGTPGGLGDPEMVVVAPIEQAIKQVGFYRNSRENITVNYVTVVLKQEGVASLRIDNSFTFNAVIDHPKLPGYKIVIKRWDISAGQGFQCFIKCDSAFNAITYGEGSVESYAYSAGAYVNNLNSKPGLHNYPDTANGGKNLHQYTCVGTPMKLSILMSYKTLKLNWDLSAISSGCVTTSPSLGTTSFLMDPADNYLTDTVFVDGIKYYQYTLPSTFTFNCANTYDIPVTSTSPGISNCGNNEYLFATVDVKARPTINFTISHPTQCTKDSIYLTGPTAGLSGATLPMLLSQYTWMYPGGTGRSKDTVIVLPAAQSQTIKLTSVTTQGCLSDTVSKTITVYAPPTTVLTALPDTVCLGQNITFTQTASYGAAGVPINNYYWDFGDGVTANTVPPTNTQVHNYSTYNTYTAKAAVRVSGLCVSDTIPKVVYVGSKAKVGFSYPTTCLPPTGLAQFVANATAQGGATITSYSWNFGDPGSGGNNTATGPSVSHTYSPTADSFKVTLSVVTSTGCTGDTSIWINANIAPKLGWSASANFNAVCQNVPLFSLAYGTVLNNVQGAPKYSGGAYIDSAGMFNPQTAGPGTHNIRFTFTSTKGCVDYKDTTITVTPKPNKPAITTPLTYCQGAAASALTATPDAGNTLKWYDNAALTNGITTAPIPSTATAGTFTYYVTQLPGVGCESDAATITVVVTPAINNNTIGSSQTICSNTAAAQLTSSATIAGGTGTYNYQWQSSTDGTNWNDVAGATNPDYTPGSLSLTTYFRRNVISGLCSSTSNVDTITVFAAITNNTITSDQTICEGSPASQLTGTAVGAGVTYQWISSANVAGPWTAIAGATGQNYQPGSLTATTVFRRVVVNGSCTDTSAAVTITITPLAVGSISGPTGICQYDYAKVKFTATAGTASFTVYLTVTNPSGVSSPVQQSVASGDSILVIPTGSAAGTYTIKLDSLRNSNGCINTTGGSPFQIIVTATPSITIIPTPSATVCEGTPVTLTASGATTYTWTGANLSNTTGNPVTATPVTSGTYTVVGATNGCTASKDTSLTVNPRPAKPTVTTPVTYCQNSTAVPLNATALAGNTLKWFTNNTLTGGSTTAPTPSTSAAGTLSFYVNQTNAGGCTSDTSTITVTVQPSISGNTLGADQTICYGNAASAIGTASLTGGDGTYTYTWEQSTDGGATWSAVIGAGGASYNPGTLITTTQFRRTVNSGLCSNTSLSVAVNVIAAITNNVISGTQQTCEGSQVTLLTGTTASAGLSYQWLSSINGNPFTAISGATGKDYQPVSLTTTTQYKRVVLNGSCTDTSNVVTVTVNPLAVGSISGPTGICQYDYAKVKFTATAGTASFTVYLTVTNPPGGTSQIQQSVASGDSILVIPAFSNAGIYTIKLDSLGNSNGCINTTAGSPMQIVVTATPVVTVDPFSAICEGKTSPLTANGATSYVWSSSAAINFNNTTANPVTASPATAGSYPYQVIGTTNGCNSAPFNGTLVVNPKPGKPSVVTPVTYCQLGPATQLQATATGSNTLKWYDNPGLTNGVTSAPTPSTTNAGTFLYYVTQTNSFGCESDTAITSIIVNPGIAGNAISGGETICQGSTPATQLTSSGTITGGNGTYTYQWQLSTDNGTTWTNIPGATSDSYSPGTLNATTQYRRVVSSGLCGSISNVITETVFIGLSNYDIASSQTICEASSPAQLIGQLPSGSGTMTYTWQQSTDNVNWTDIPSSNTKDYQPPVLSTTTYYRRKVTNGPCTGFSSAVQIFVKPLPMGTITAKSAAICEYDADSVIFTSSVGTAPFDIVLTITSPTGTTTKNATVNSGDVISVIAANSSSGSYNVTLTSITSNGCTRSTGLNNVPITVKPTPLVAASDVTICEGVPATLNASGADTYAWSGSSLSSTTGASVTANPTVTSVYTVTGTTNGCNSVPKDVNVFVNPKPVVTIIASQTVLCLDSSVTFSLTSSIASGSIVNYYWDFDNGNTWNGANPPTQKYATHRTYNTKLYAVSDKNCTSVTDTKAITVNPLPVADFVLPKFVCLPNNSADFQNTSSIANGAHLDYAWSFGDPASGSLNTSTAVNGSHVYADSNKYTITLSVVSAQGCSAQKVQDFDAFLKKPVAKFTVSPDTLCQGIRNDFTDLSFAPGSTISKRLWAFGDGSSLLDSASAGKIYALPGNYTITLTVQNTQGCSADYAQKVVVYLQPVIDAGSSFVVPIGTTVTFNARANSPSLQFAWTSPTGATVSDPTVLKPMYIADQDAKFILTATGQGNCKAWDSITVKVLRPITIPNAFSPNGDNINDKWEIKNLEDYPNCVVEVFNRYGQPVYRSFGYKAAWDGSYKGTPLPVGTYYYIIEPKNGFPAKTGYVVIVK